jgi:hypothetical protein
MFIDKKFFNPNSPKILIFFVKVLIYLFNMGRDKKFFFIKDPTVESRSIFYGDSTEEEIIYHRLSKKHFVLEMVKCPRGDPYWYDKFYPCTGVGFKVRFNKIKWMKN